ncbi:MAG: TetR/AcrR family transcriptional regulator [Parvularculaceae bacterium]|nr:TetR/AcrR family transcriptional regulator [Parvularculaceae bacterium]
MARTQAADYDQKREIITAKAAELFARRGFSAASVSELAQTCKISKSLIYHYYASKEAILFAAMSDHMDTLVELICNRAKATTTPEAEFRSLTRDILQCYTGAAHHQKILLYELSFLPAPQQKEIVAKQRAVIAEIEALLLRINPRTKANKKKLRAKVMLYFGMMNWTHTWFNASGPISRNELADEISNTTLCSLN